MSDSWSSRLHFSTVVIFDHLTLSHKIVVCLSSRQYVLTRNTVHFYCSKRVQDPLKMENLFSLCNYPMVTGRLLPHL